MRLFRKKEKNIINTNFYSLSRLFKFKKFDFFHSNAKNALKINMFFTCVKIIANAIATTPINIINKNNRVINDDLIYLLKHKPNSNQTAFDFWQLIAFDLLLFGNSYIRINRDRAGEVISLDRLQGDLIEISDDNNIIEYIYNGKESYRENELIHYKMFSFNGLKGIKPIDLLLNSFNVSKGLDSFLQSENLPPILKTPEELLQDEQVAELANQVNDKLQKTPFVLPAGFELLLNNSKSIFDNKFAELKKISNEEIARFFNIPFGLVGLDGASQPNVLDTQNNLFLQQALNPYLRMIEQTTENALFSRLEIKNGYRVKFNRNALIYQIDANARAIYYDKMLSMGIYTIDKIKELEDLTR